MSGMGESLEKASKLPFANYDLAVYFGVGICSLPFLTRYVLAERSSKFPAIFSGYADPLINNIVSIVALVFGVYIIGHGIALLSSLFVEQFLYRMVGPPSRIIASSAVPNPVQGNYFKTILRKNVLSILRNKIDPADIIRLLFQIPVLPAYIVMYYLRVFGFYESKISSFVVFRVQTRLEQCFEYRGSILHDDTWFKIVEYACANDHPSAMAKMYNYLMMYGLFRSISFLALCAIWLEMLFWYTIGGIGFIDDQGNGNIFVRLVVLYGLYTISFIGFAKFSRRYSEEAIQAFALSKSFEVVRSS